MVYRKHWFVLIRKAWLPILGLLGIIGLFIYRLYLIATSPATLVSTENGSVNVDAWAGALFLLFFVFLAWFIYDFVDWSNDRFEITNEQIIDRYKKPLSTEIRNVSQMENILGTEFERVGILGTMFNYGTVFITIGGTRLTFEDVIDPSTVVNLHLIYKSVGDYSLNNQISRVILVTTPRAKNSYLHNQEGFFLIDLQADYFNYPPLEGAIANIQNELVNKGKSQFNSDQILKLQLSWNFVPELLALLWFEFYNIAKMQTTLDKSVQALKDHSELFR